MALTEVQEFMTVHALDSPSELSLKYSKKLPFDIGAVALQIGLRKKALKKIPAFINTKTVLLPKLYEQCTQEEVAKYKASLIKGNSLLDATAGLGIDSYYIGQSFKQRTCIEANAEHAQILKHNYEALNFESEIIHATLEEFLANDKRVFETIYIDPDRRPEFNRKVFEINECTPNVLELKDVLLSRCQSCWIKLSPMVDIHQVVQSFFPNLCHVICIAYGNEMKEILIQLKPGNQVLRYEAVNITSEGVTQFQSNKNDVKPLLSLPGKYFFEPNVAMIKSKLCMEYSHEKQLKVLYPNGYFFTTDAYQQDLQGRLFEIIEHGQYKKELLNAFIKKHQIKKANIACRNFFWKPEEVKQQFKLHDGGEWYLFCYADAEKKPQAIWAKKILEASL